MVFVYTPQTEVDKRVRMHKAVCINGENEGGATTPQLNIDVKHYSYIWLRILRLFMNCSEETYKKESVSYEVVSINEENGMLPRYTLSWILYYFQSFYYSFIYAPAKVQTGLSAHTVRME